MGEQVSYSLSEAVAENTSGISGNRISPFLLEILRVLI